MPDNNNNLPSAAPQEFLGQDTYFKEIIDSSPAILWITRPDGYCTYLSSQWYEKTGQAAGEGLGYGWLDATHPDDKEESGKIFAQANANHTKFLTSYRLKQKNGEYRWSIDAGNPRFSADGTYLGMVGTVVDIHDSRQSQVDLDASRERFARVLTATEVGVWYCDLPFDELIWDARVKEHFWLAPDARVTIEIFYERIHPEDRELTRAAIAASIENRSGYDIEYRTVNESGGQVKWIRAIGSTSYNSEGDPIRFDGVTLDVTELRLKSNRLKTLQKEAIKRGEELEAAVNARDEFLSIASHELRTPLTSLKMQIQMTRKLVNPTAGTMPSADQLARYLDLSNRQVARLTALIEDLLDVSRIESGKMSYTFEVVRLGSLLGEVVERFVDPSKPVPALTEIEISDEVEISCDRFRIEQVVINLITNAIKYGNGKPIRISLEKSKAGATVKVTDEGIGIASDKQPLIFNRFERAISHNNISGLGLGLYISKQIVDAHHGSLRVESELNIGSVFTLELPMNPEKPLSS